MRALFPDELLICISNHADECSFCNDTSGGKLSRAIIRGFLIAVLINAATAERPSFFPAGDAGKFVTPL